MAKQLLEQKYQLSHDKIVIIILYSFDKREMRKRATPTRCCLRAFPRYPLRKQEPLDFMSDDQCVNIVVSRSKEVMSIVGYHVRWSHQNSLLLLGEVIHKPMCVPWKS